MLMNIKIYKLYIFIDKLLQNLMNILLVALLIVQFIQELGAVACPADKPYQYNSVCYSECPWSPPIVTYLDTLTSTCVTSCSGPNYFADDSTKTCTQSNHLSYEGCPSYPIMTYYDHVRQKCVQKCPSAPSQFSYASNRSCLAECPDPLYADESTRDCVGSCPTGMYYQIVGTMRICTNKCYPNFYANESKICVAASSCPSAPVKYYGDDLSGLCVKSCPQNSDTYAEESTRKCVQHCTLGTFADPTTLRCVSSCPTLPAYFGSNTTRMCHLKCIQGEFAYEANRQCYAVCPQGFGDYLTRKCVDVCPQSNKTFADPQTKLCIAVCSPGYFADDATRSCVSSVDCTGSLVGNPLNLQCIDSQDCPVGYFIDFTLFLCVKRCISGQYANLDTRICSTTCPWNPPINITFKEESTRRCVQECPANPRTFSDNLTQSCVDVCSDPYFGSPLNYDCVDTCPDGFFGETVTNLCVSTCTTNTSSILYFYALNTSCLAACPEGSYKDNTTLTCVQICPDGNYAREDTNECVPNCPNLTYADYHSKSCASQCPAITKQYADSSTNLCVDVCPLNPDYFGEDLNDGNRKCVLNCTKTDVFADPISRTCVKQCNFVQGYFGYLTDKRCVLRCPVGYGNPINKLCTATCPQSPIQTYGDNLTSTCVTRCPNGTYGDKTQQLCLNATDCPSNTYADDSTNVCINRCSSLLGLFGDPVTKKCVKSCQFGYYSDNTSRLCTQTCNTTAKLFKDPSTRRCVLDCPSNPDLYNDPANNMCVPNCTGSNFPYKYRYMTLRRCVAMCPSSPAYFADEQTKNCVLRCANGTFRFVNNTYRGCVSYCPLQVFNATINTTLYEDNTTWACVAVCPLGFYSFKHPTDPTIRKCVRMCRIVAGVYYFADDVSRSCVTQCPTKVWNTWGDRLIFKCVKNCSRKQYRDITTKQCTYNCPDTPVQYFADNSTWNCSKTCPTGTFAQSTNNTCAKQCPTNYYGYAKKCLSQCPAGTTVYEDNTTWTCINKCSMLPDYYSDSQNQKCVKNCTVNTFADWDTRSCVAALKCSGTTVADPLTFRCVAQCSKTPMYFVTTSTNLCGAFCTGGLFAFNDTNKCVDACPAPYFGVNLTTNYYCIQYCPTNQLKFINQTSNFRICIGACPTGYFKFVPGMQCIKICPDGYWGNTSNNECIQDCTPLYADDTTNMCVDTCPNGSTADNNTYSCKGKCRYGQFMENKVCVTACSPGFYADNLTRSCLQSCPFDPFTFADPFVKKCVFQCSSGYYGYFDNRTCQLSTCPTGLFKQMDLRICISPCLEDQFGDPQSLQCVTSCSLSTYPYADPTSQQCVQTCPSTPDLYGNLNKCIDQCPNGRYAQNQTRTCVSICPNKTANTLEDSYADDLSRRCVSRCSALSYAYKNITHNTCENFCPQGVFASQILQACVAVCPNTTFARNDTNQCVSRCPKDSWGDLLTKTCTDACYNGGQFADNSTNMCINKCPSDPDFYGEVSSKSCVLSCQSGFYAHPLDRICVQVCFAPYFADPSSLLCVLSCPMHEFLYSDDFNATNRTCVSSCKNYSGAIYYADPTTKKCIPQCPKLPKLLYGLNSTNFCKQTCPAGTFGDNDTRLCLKQCIFQHPKFTWMDGVDNMCVKECPLGYFSDNVTKSCEQVCSVGMFADNSTRKCVYGCPVNPSSFATTDSLGNPVCAYTCVTGLYADQTTRSCVPKCPLTPFYYFHMNLTNSCQKECLFPYFGERESQFCVPKCKDGFYGNLTTKKCQACRTQCVTCSAYLQCLTCQLGFYLYEFQCVTACPTYPILYFSLESSTKCFRKCPTPYYGLESTKKCQLGCPVSYYPNDNTRICTLCPTGCLTCDSAGCLSCLNGYTYLNTTKSCNQYCNLTHIYYFKDQCYNVCPEGSFLSKNLVNCDACASQCAACSLTAANCTKCANKFYYQGLCVDACPSDFFVNEELACISCSVNPERCKQDPLTYNITPFTENFQQKAYITFSRPVSMTLDQFNQAVQINFNGRALKTGQFTAVVFNTTTYVVTILVSAREQSLKIQYKPRVLLQNPGQEQKNQAKLISDSIENQFSLNENTLTIGFKPGTITDTNGNMLTVNTLEQKFEAPTDVVNSQTILLTQKISTSSQVLTWIFLGLIFLLLIKTGYPVLILLEVAQIIYMHIFLYAGPMPFLELKFLDKLKYFHFTFFPQLFGANITEKAYENVSVDMSFLANASPFIFVWGIVGFIYLLFTILSSKKIKSNKTVRKFAKRARKYRLRFGILNDAFWITYIYAMFFAIYQFKNASFGSGLMVGNFFFSCIVFVLYLIFTVYMVKLASQYKEKSQEDIPKKLRFITPEPSSFPMEMPMRYIRKLCLCFALAMPSFEAQIVIMLMTNIVFMTYCMCFTPSKSKVTNYVNFAIEIGYIVIEGLFYGYFKLENKTAEEQFGFACTLIAVQALILLLVFIWAFARMVSDFRQSETWKYIYMKLTENKDPEYLKKQQKKRDLDFDFGSLQNQSQLEDANGNQPSSNNLNIKKRTFEPKVFFDAEIGAKQKKKKQFEDKKTDKKTKRTSTELEMTISINQKSLNEKSINQKSLQEKSIFEKSSSKEMMSQSAELNDKQLQSTLKPVETKKTRIKTPFAGKRSELLKVDSRLQHEMQEVVVFKNVEEQKKEQKKGIWDDLEFDENQI